IRCKNGLSSRKLFLLRHATTLVDTASRLTLPCPDAIIVYRTWEPFIPSIGNCQHMTPQLILKRQSFTQVAPKEVDRARTAPDVLKDLLSSPNRRRSSLDMYWHAVPYLLTGLSQNMDEPYRWFIESGEILGQNDAGDIRYLSPSQAMEL